MPLIEKAYAKLFGCYYILTGGFIDEALTDLTGFAAEKMNNLHDKKGNFVPEVDEFWNFLMECKGRGCLMGCSRKNATSSKPESRVIIDGEDTGILASHAYGIMDVIELKDDRVEKDRKCHRLLRIRNPWGHTEWKGKWTITSETEELEDEDNITALEAYIHAL